MRYLLLYNPVSGKGKFRKKIPLIESYFADKQLKLDIYESKSMGDLEKKAEELASKYDVYLASGGDGSINEVVNGIMKSSFRPHLAVLPSGTANDIAAILGITKNVKKTLDLVTTTTPVGMDVNLLNNRYFIYTTAAGILTKISYAIPRSKVKKFGYFAYLTEGAKDIFKDYNMKMQVEHDMGLVEGKYMLVLGLSANRVGGMFLKKFSESSLNDGKLELRLIAYRRCFKLFKLLKFFLKGGKKSKNEIQLSSSFYQIKTSEDVVWNTDGEKSCCGEVKIEVFNKEILIYASDKSKRKYFGL
ncbi:MAG: YegS/Rv2252/BmrU family lipid kinase [Acholeplasma sp.]|nr:YegS/Rv2252/BmrU family lipid kinase [Acholeplasma sp.]